MSRRSRRYRKRFQCGHRGFGRFCHCCADRERMKFIKKERVKCSVEHQSRTRERTKKDSIGLYKLPRAIARKARGVLDQIVNGTEYWKLGGKRLAGERSVIRIPIGYRYRMLCRDESDSNTEHRIVPLRVMSHEAYNPLVRRGQGLLARLFSSGWGDR
jgi:hypothetical protein